MGQSQWDTNINRRDREGTTSGRFLEGKAAFRATVSCYQSTDVSARAESQHWPFLLTQTATMRSDFTQT